MKNCQQTIPVLCCILVVQITSDISSLLMAMMVMGCSTSTGAGAIVAVTLFCLWPTPALNMASVAVQTTGPSNIIRVPCSA